MLKWIVWNRTDYLYKMNLALNNLQKLICHKNQPTIYDIFSVIWFRIFLSNDYYFSQLFGFKKPLIINFRK